MAYGNVVLDGIGAGNIVLEGLGGLEEAWFNVSIRQQIMGLIGTRLEGILIADGYETDIGSRVYEWRQESIPEALIPCLVYRDDPEESFADETVPRGRHRHRLMVSVDVVALGSLVISTVRKMIADVIKAVGADTTWGGVALNTEPPMDEIYIEQKERKIGGATVKFVILYETGRWNPAG